MYWTKGKALINFSFAFYHNDNWMISKLIQSVCDVVISYYEINTTVVIGGYFQVWNYINEKLIKNLLIF